MYAAGDVDAFQPDYETWPLLEQASCLQTTLTPGDVVYYPENYWHQTVNLETPSVALSSSVLRSSNHAQVRQRLVEECQGEGAIFAPVDELCGNLNSCYDLWETVFASPVAEL